MKSSVLDTIAPHYIIDHTGKKTGMILDIATFKLIIEELEDLHDTGHAHKIVAEGEVEEGRTFEAHYTRKVSNGSCQFSRAYNCFYQACREVSRHT